MQFDPRYKPRQFGKDTLAAGVSGNEFYNSMSRVYAPGRTQRWIPAFYTNDAQLRAVLAKAVIGYIVRSARVPENLNTDLANLQRLALGRQVRVEEAEHCWNATIEHLNAVRTAGSYLALLAAISYRAWRLAWHNRDVAESIGLTAEGVKRILRRLVLYGEEMGFETYKPRKDAGKGNCDYVGVMALWTAGLTTRQISRELRCSIGGVKHTLRMAGVYVWNRNCGHGISLRQYKDGHRRCPECIRIYQREYQRDRRAVTRSAES
jgi:hypothetical protein